MMMIMMVIRIIIIIINVCCHNELVRHAYLLLSTMHTLPCLHITWYGLEYSGILCILLRLCREFYMVVEDSGLFGWSIQRGDLLGLTWKKWQKLTVLMRIPIQSTKGIQSTRGQYGLLRTTTTTTTATTATATATSGYCDFTPVCYVSGYWCYSIKLSYVTFHSL